MSYSFQVRGATKAAALTLVAAQLDAVVAFQPVHAADRAQALATAEAFVNLLPDCDAKDVSVSVNGYVMGQWDKSDLVELSGASVGVSASLVNREPATT